MKTNTKYRLLALLLALTLLTLTACGSSTSSTSDSQAGDSSTEETTTASEEAAADEETEAEDASAEEETAAEESATDAAEDVDDPYYTLSSDELRAEAEAYTGEVTTLVVSGPSTFASVSYYDDDDNLTGFEVEVLRAIDELLPEYEFDFQPSSDLSTIFLSVEQNKVDIAYCQIEWNEERAEKYLYTNDSYCNFPLRITVLEEDENDYQTLADLAGKTVAVTTGGNDAYLVEKWNEEHPDQAVIIEYSANDVTIRDTELKNGTIDAYISVERYTLLYNESYGVSHKCVGEVLEDSKCYFITNLENTELRDRLDTAIAALKADGTLSELCIEFLGGDYVQ